MKTPTSARPPTTTKISSSPGSAHPTREARPGLDWTGIFLNLIGALLVLAIFFYLALTPSKPNYPGPGTDYPEWCSAGPMC